MLLAGALTIGAVEATAAYLQALYVWEPYLHPPLIPIFITLSAMVSDELKQLGDPWRETSLSGFQKSSRMISGALIAAIGQAVTFSGLSDVLVQATFSTAVGISLAWADVYVIRRFSG